MGIAIPPKRVTGARQDADQPVVAAGDLPGVPDEGEDHHPARQGQHREVDLRVADAEGADQEREEDRRDDPRRHPEKGVGGDVGPEKPEPVGAGGVERAVPEGEEPRLPQEEVVPDGEDPKEHDAHREVDRELPGEERHRAQGQQDGRRRDRVPRPRLHRPLTAWRRRVPAAATAGLPPSG